MNFSKVDTFNIINKVYRILKKGNINIYKVRWRFANSTKEHKDFVWVLKSTKNIADRLDAIYYQESKRVINRVKVGYFRIGPVRKFEVNFETPKYYYDRCEIIDWHTIVVENDFNRLPIYIYPADKLLDIGRKFIVITFELKKFNLSYTSNDLTYNEYLCLRGV